MEQTPNRPHRDRAFWRGIALNSLAIAAGLALLVTGDDWVARGVALVNVAFFGGSVGWLVARRRTSRTA